MNAREGEKREVRREGTKKQKVWQMIRRNPKFCVCDVMLVADVNEGFCRTFFWALEKAGYVRIDKKGSEFRARQYMLLMDTGPQSPSVANGVVYDYNTKQTYKVKGEK